MDDVVLSVNSPLNLKELTEYDYKIMKLKANRNNM